MQKHRPSITSRERTATNQDMKLAVQNREQQFQAQAIFEE
jgi:hypothetical protein